MKQRLRDYFTRISEQKWLYPALLVFSLLESIIIPIPLEFVLVPLMLQGERKYIWRLAGTAFLGFVAGATLGYFAAVYLFDQLSQWLLAAQDSQQYFDMAQTEMTQNGFWYLLTVGLTPVPSQIAMFAAGSTGFPFLLFFIAMAATRFVRYFALGWVIHRWGASGYRWLNTHKSRAKKVAAVALIIAIVYELLF